MAAGVIGAFQAGRGFFGSLLRQGGSTQQTPSSSGQKIEAASAEEEGSDES